MQAPASSSIVMSASDVESAEDSKKTAAVPAVSPLKGGDSGAAKPASAKPV